jgi:ubiquinone/menaquinone biosynthesis C-methylase UbiE
MQESNRPAIVTFGEEEQRKTEPFFPSNMTEQHFTNMQANTDEEFWDNQSTLPGFQGVTVDDHEHTATKLLYNFLQIEFDFAGKRIVDIGCGVGRLFPVFIGGNARSISGVDISLGMLKVARFKHPHPFISLHKLTASNLVEFTNSQFDISVICTTFCHMSSDEEVKQAISESCRVVAVGGLVIVIEPLTINSFRAFEHSKTYLRPKQFLTDEFVKHNTNLIYQSRECFGALHNIDSYKTILVYSK